MRVVVLFLCTWFLCFPEVIQATPITFDFSNSVSDYFYQADEFSLQVKAYAYDKPDLYLATITQTGDGIGVSSKDGDDGQLENSGPDDFLIFEFSRTVNLQRVEFSLVDAGDEFVIGVDLFSLSKPIKIWTDQSVPLIDKLCVYDFDLNSDLFKFSSGDSKDKFRIKSLTFDDPVPAPEPSAWLLMSAAGGALVYWRRRQ